MSKVYREAHWYESMTRRAWVLTRSGDYEPGTEQEIDIVLGDRQVQMLRTALDEQGWIKPRLDERLRSEDLKITHRLLDVIEKSLKS